jgi:hypothetical protein
MPHLNVEQLKGMDMNTTNPTGGRLRCWGAQ